MNKEVKLFMVYDILSDTIRTGPQLWKVDRKRLADIRRIKRNFANNRNG